MTGISSGKILAENKISYASEEDSRLKRWLISSLETLSGQRKIQRRYERLQQMELEPEQIWQQALSLLDVKTVFDQDQLDRIPLDGPLVFLSNHPFGVVDGLIFGDIVSRVRKEFVVLVHEVLLGQDERLDKFLLPVDFRENRKAIENNIRTKQIAQQYLKENKAVAIFPAGGVATSPKGFGKAEDLEWKRFPVKLIQISKATVIPMYFHGQNSRMFQLVSQVSQTLRYGMLLHEVRNKMGKNIRVNIGSPIPYEEISHIKDRQQLLDQLREVIFDLKNQ